LSLVQLIECIKCGNNHQFPYDSRELTPWDVWPSGCPKCGCIMVDVTVVMDKLGRKVSFNPSNSSKEAGHDDH